MAGTPRLSGAFSRTTVLATDGDSPNTIPAIRLQPHAIASVLRIPAATQRAAGGSRVKLDDSSVGEAAKLLTAAP